MNAPEVTVARRPVVALIATGDELVMPGEDPGPDQIIASNAYGLKRCSRPRRPRRGSCPSPATTPRA
jgi:molybdopterin biosynthesis enzyme